MIREDTTKIIEVVHSVCCGLDVHKGSISACLLFLDDKARERVEVKEFGTLTDDITQLRDWLLDHGCPVAAMESTGVYWRPVHIGPFRREWPSCDESAGIGQRYLAV